MTESKRTSFMRYKKVHEILKGDNALSKRLSTRMTAVCKTDQTFVDFPVEVIHVTDEIHKQGLDVANMSKIDVIRHGHRLLIANPNPIPMPQPVAPAATAPAPAKKPKAKPPKPPKAAPPPPPPPKAAKPKASKPKKKAPAPKGQATAALRPAAVEPNTPGEVAKAEPPPKLPPAYVRPYIPNVVGIAALSNLQAVLTLFEPFMAAGDTDAKEVCQKANELIDDIHRRTVLPCAEKESTSTG